MNVHAPADTTSLQKAAVNVSFVYFFDFINSVIPSEYMLFLHRNDFYLSDLGRSCWLAKLTTLSLVGEKVLCGN